jgi:6,7-dimethyl-8-ribityllumazine synthase
MKIGIVTAEFNSRYTHALRDAALEVLNEKGFESKNIIVKSVPGAFELPIVAKSLIQKHKVDGVLCYGAVIRGETDHYDYVCGAAADGCLQVGLETLKPVQFGVLTVDNRKQLFDRIWGKKGNKGREVALGLLDTLEALK